MPDPITPDQRSLRARIAAHASWANTPDPAARTAAARANSLNSVTRWEREIDPDGVLPADERTRRAESARRAYMAQLAYRSARARATRKASQGGDAA